MRFRDNWHLLTVEHVERALRLWVSAEGYASDAGGWVPSPNECPRLQSRPGKKNDRHPSRMIMKTGRILFFSVSLFKVVPSSH